MTLHKSIKLRKQEKTETYSFAHNHNPTISFDNSRRKHYYCGLAKLIAKQFIW